MVGSFFRVKFTPAISIILPQSQAHIHFTSPEEVLFSLSSITKRLPKRCPKRFFFYFNPCYRIASILLQPQEFTLPFLRFFIGTILVFPQVHLHSQVLSERPPVVICRGPSLKTINFPYCNPVKSNILHAYLLSIYIRKNEKMF